MSAIMAQQSGFNDVTLLKLAREIAMDIRPLADILETHEVDAGQWAVIQNHTVFRNYLRNAIEEWNSAGNTSERVKLKTLAMVEESLPEFYARMHDKDESLQHKTDILKTIAKFAGLEKANVEASAGEKLSVTINLGADHQLRIERDVTPQVTIEGSAE